MNHSDIISDTIQCTRCHKKFYEEGFKVSRLRHRLNTCLECNARSQRRNQSKVEYDYSCEHVNNRNACKVCNPQSAACSKNTSDVRKFSTRAWPESHVCIGGQFTYDFVVTKWNMKFTEMIKYRTITQEVFTKIMANKQSKVTHPPPEENFHQEIDELLAEF